MCIRDSLCSDHYHYWEDGGATYHNRYSTWEISRGQEGDPWKGEVKDPQIPPCVIEDRRKSFHWRQDWINRKYMPTVASQPQGKTFAMGEEFIHTNHSEDNWFLTIETFDPHEPYFTHHKFKNLYRNHYKKYKGQHFDWPPYRRVNETVEEIEHCRFECAALHSMCDYFLGKIIALMDKYNLWKDTMLIVNTDHGFLLGEHDWWGKMAMPMYDEIIHTPLFIWDPRCGCKNMRRNALVQTIDLAPTILDFFGISIPADMQGKALKEVIAYNKPVRDTCLFGAFGGQVNITDGRYVYMRGPQNTKNTPLFNYTLMPTHMRNFFSTEELAHAKLVAPFSFTRGIPLLKIPFPQPTYKELPDRLKTMLFDLHSDPFQQHPISNKKVEGKMIKCMKKLMKENDAPPEQFDRLGL